jgi:hypothetical protein
MNIEATFEKQIFKCSFCSKKLKSNTTSSDAESGSVLIWVGGQGNLFFPLTTMFQNMLYCDIILNKRVGLGW